MNIKKSTEPTKRIQHNLKSIEKTFAWIMFALGLILGLLAGILLIKFLLR